MLRETRVAYGEKLAELIEKDPNVVVLDADLAGSTKTASAKKVCPERHFDMGIAEQNMMGVAAGLAASGKTVFASSFAMFATGRPFEIIRNSICYPEMNVKICASHAGLSVGEDGASHQACEDIAIMRALPNMRVFVPCDYNETKAVIEEVYKIPGPCYARFGRGKVEDVFDENYKFDFSKINILKTGKKVALLACGLMVQESLKAYELLKAEGIEVTVVDVCTIKPIDKEGVTAILKDYDYVLTLEEHTVIGGLYSAVAEVKGEMRESAVLKPIAVMDRFGESGKMLDVLKEYGLTADRIVKSVKKLY